MNALIKGEKKWFKAKAKFYKNNFYRVLLYNKYLY